MAKIQAYNNASGEYQIIPEHWLDIEHPAFQFTKEPRKGNKAAPAEPKKTRITEPAEPENKEG